MMTIVSELEAKAADSGTSELAGQCPQSSYTSFSDDVWVEVVEKEEEIRPEGNQKRQKLLFTAEIPRRTINGQGQKSMYRVCS